MFVLILYVFIDSFTARVLKHRSGVLCPMNQLACRFLMTFYRKTIKLRTRVLLYTDITSESQ